MGLIFPGDKPREDVADRFFIAQDGKPSSEQLGVQNRIREGLYVSAEYLNANVEDSREKSLAITKIEEALMWAGKAIFK